MTATHGFVDESIRAGWYRLTAVEIRSRDLADVTRAIRARVPTGQTRLHIASESAQRKRTILGAFSKLPIAATTFETPYDRRSDDQVARDRCLRALADRALSSGLSVLVLDTRGPDRDLRDRRALSQTLRGRDGSLAYSHRGSRDELLLALPDGIGWAVGAGRPWRELISDVAHTIDVGERG